MGSAIGYTMLPLQKYLDWCPCSPARFAVTRLLNSVKQLSQNKTSLNGRVGFGRILTPSSSLLPFLGFFSSDAFCSPGGRLSWLAFYCCEKRRPTESNQGRNFIS